MCGGNPAYPGPIPLPKLGQGALSQSVSTSVHVDALKITVENSSSSVFQAISETFSSVLDAVSHLLSGPLDLTDRRLRCAPGVFAL